MDDKSRRLLTYWQSDKLNISLLLDLFESLRVAADFKTLISIYLEISNKINHESVHLYAIESYLAIGQHDKASEVISLLDSDKPDVVFLKSRLFFDTGNIDEAVNLLSTDLCNTQKHLPSIELLARCYFIKGELSEAINLLKCIQNPSIEALGLLALCLFDDENYVDARLLYNEVLDRAPLQLDAMIAKCSDDLYHHKFNDVETRLLQCVKVYPWLGRALALLGQYYFIKQDFQASKTYLKQAVEANYKHIGSYHVLAWSCLFLDQISLAKEAFNSALTLAPSFSDTHAGLSIVAIAEGDFELSKQYCKKAMKLDPNSFTSRYAQSLLYEQKGEKEQAVAIIETIVNETNPLTGLTHKEHIVNHLKY